MVSSLQATGCNTKCTHGCVHSRVCVCVCVMNPNVCIFACANDGGNGRKLFQRVVVFVCRLCVFVSVCLRVLYLHTHTDTTNNTPHRHTHTATHTQHTHTYTHYTDEISTGLHPFPKFEGFNVSASVSTHTHTTACVVARCYDTRLKHLHTSSLKHLQA
jgi:hypothetical protein